MGNQFATSKNNARRRFEIDVVKFLAIVFMVCVHVYEDMSVIDWSVPHTDVFGNVIEFLGGPLTAPVFMFTMGIGMVLTHHDTPKEFAKRGLHLFAAGYVLNFIRGPLPLLTAKILGIDPEVDYTILSSLMITDILQFAGLTFLLAAALKKLKLKSVYIFIIAIVMQAAGCAVEVWSETLPPSFISYVAGLFIFAGGVTCFPFLTWFVFPAAGMVFGELLQKNERAYKQAFAAGVGVLAATLSYVFLSAYDIRNFYALANEAFYKQDLLGFLFTISIVIIELSLAYFVFRGSSSLISFCSINLTRIYFIQWVVITVLTAALVIFEPGDITKGLVIPYAFVIFSLSVGICRVSLLSKIFKSNARKY